jgi:signal transduction histidine kinase
MPFSNLVGYSPDELIGKSTTTLCDNTEAPPRFDADLISTPGRYPEIALRTASGAVIRVDGRVWHLNMVAPEPVCVLSIDDQDIPLKLIETLATKHSALRESHDHLQHAYNELELKNDILDQRNRERDALHARLARNTRLATMGELAAGMAHTIRNPLAAATSTLQRLSSKLLSGQCSLEEQQTLIERAARALDRINSFLDGLQRLSPTQRPHLPKSTRILDEVELAYDILGQKRHAENQLKTDIPSSLRVAASSEDLHIILTNILDNALSVIATDGLIHVSAQIIGQQVEITIADDGPGIPEEIRERLFEPFVSSKTLGKGTGMGLALTRAAAERYGGTVELKNGKRGATFVVTLPAATTGGEA